MKTVLKSIQFNDGRYTGNQEFCGYAVPLFVVRFCGERIGAASCEDKARHIVEVYEQKRMKAFSLIEG